MMNATWTYLLVIIALAAIATLSIKSCSDRRGATNSPTYTQRQIDSVRHQAEQSQKEIDRLVREKNRVESVKDSLSLAISLTATKLDIQSLKAKVAVREAQIAREELNKQKDGEKDYTDFVDKCDSLIPQVDSLINLVEVSKREVLLSKNAYDSLLSVNSLHAARLEFDRDFYKEKFENSSQVALQLEKSNSTLSKKAAKRLGIGPSVGVTYDGEVKPMAGISLQWHVIRF